MTAIDVAFAVACGFETDDGGQRPSGHVYSDEEEQTRSHSTANAIEQVGIGSGLRYCSSTIPGESNTFADARERA